MTKNAKRNLRQEVTDKVLEALKNGVAPWVKPWTGKPGDGVHMNPDTKTVYKGINVWLLNIAQMANGYSSSEWVTFRGAKKLGGSVKPRPEDVEKGEWGHTVIYWQFIEKKDENGNPTGEKFPLLRHFTVFNRDQCDNLPETEVEEVPEFERHARAEATIEATGAKISYGGNQACYIPASDSIRLPNKENFHNPESFYSTAFHELIHWTGSEDRLKRTKGKRFGDADYAFEELVAEMGAGFLCAEHGISGELQHESYIGSWITALESDNNFVISASSKAQKASDFIANPKTKELKKVA